MYFQLRSEKFWKSEILKSGLKIHSQNKLKKKKNRIEMNENRKFHSDFHRDQ